MKKRSTKHKRKENERAGEKDNSAPPPLSALWRRSPCAQRDAVGAIAGTPMPARPIKTVQLATRALWRQSDRRAPVNPRGSPERLMGGRARGRRTNLALRASLFVRCALTDGEAQGAGVDRSWCWVNKNKNGSTKRNVCARGAEGGRERGACWRSRCRSRPRSSFFFARGRFRQPRRQLRV